MNEKTKKASFIWTVLVVVLAIIVAYVFISKFVKQDKTVSLFGFQICVVESESMVPFLQIDDLFLTREVTDFSTLQSSQLINGNYDNSGDVIVFVADETWGSMQGRLITHRIVGISQNENGEFLFETKGDNNSSKDSGVVKQENVVGVFQAKLVVLGFFYHTLLSPIGLLLIIAVIGSIIIMEVVNIIKTLKADDSNEQQ